MRHYPHVSEEGTRERGKARGGARENGERRATGTWTFIPTAISVRHL